MNDEWLTNRVVIDHDPLDMSGWEWLLTNGSGAYAMGTLPGFNTRRYHGLFIAATRPPVGRVVVMNQAIERLAMDDGETILEFSACRFKNEFGDDIHAPRGFEMLRRFERGTAVRWFYEHNGITFTRVLQLHWREQAATLTYHIAGLSGPATLTVGPQVTLRDFHSLLAGDDASEFAVAPHHDACTVRRGEITAVFWGPGSRFTHHPDWWYGLYYSADAERGQDPRENCYVPGRFAFRIEPGRPTACRLSIALGREPVKPHSPDHPRHTYLKPVRHRLADLHCNDLIPATLAIAADDFLVQRHVRGRNLATIMAGYPWFADWGRDTFIALPGLLLSTGRFDEAEAVLRCFAQSMRDGLVPNRFDDYDDQHAHYNTVDASLWFVHAGMQYRLASGDTETWEAWLADACTRVIEAYHRGTYAGSEENEAIHADADGLIEAGTRRSQLTWMDAAAEGVVFTPRHGKAVEINALWYHTLAGMSELMSNLDEPVSMRFGRMAANAKRSFNRAFWDENRGYLNDRIYRDDEGNVRIDPTLRPNQIFAVSLPHSPLAQSRQKKVLAAVRDHLLTPFGLRTLPTNDPNYHGRYQGGPFQRDEAYHQGTVWPWLLGPYAEAILRAGKFGPAARKRASAVLDPLLQFMTQDGLGQIREIHEGDLPHRPVGCVGQAWSVAEVLRVLKMLHDTRDQAGSTKSIAPQAGTKPISPASARKRRTASRPVGP